MNIEKNNNLQLTFSETSNILEQWLTKKLQLNVNKTIYVNFSQKQVNDPI